jgi:hypothetical protein
MSYVPCLVSHVSCLMSLLCLRGFVALWFDRQMIYVFRMGGFEYFKLL